MKKKVIITGAFGFIGQDLVKQLDCHVYDVTLITRNPDKRVSFGDEPIELVQADLHDVDSLKRAFENQDILINYAAEVRNPELFEKTNVEGTKNIIEAIRHSSIQKVIHLSSVGVLGIGYSPDANSVSETDFEKPQNEYERTKLISENLFLEAAATQVFSLVVVRPTNVFGENHPFNPLLNLMQRFISGKNLFATEMAMVNYVYVGDLNAFVLQTLEDNKLEGIFNFGQSMKLISLYHFLKKELNSESRITVLPQIAARLAHSVRIKKLQAISNKVAYSDQKLKEKFAYIFGIENGIKRTILFYKQKNLLK